MGKVIIKQEFHDKSNYSKIYKVGEIHEFTDERASHLIDLGLAIKEETIATNPKKSKKEK